MSRTLSLVGAMLLASTTVWAAVPEAAAPIAALDNGLLQAMKSGKTAPFEARYVALAPLVTSAFNLDAILETSVGPHWASFPATEQAALRAEFTRFTVANYVANFNSFSGEKIELQPDMRAIGAEQVVSTRIIPTSGDPARLDYVMKQGGAGWQAVDVLLDGTISRVAVQRSDFRAMLGAGGAEALLDGLKKKVAALSGGTTLP